MSIDLTLPGFEPKIASPKVVVARTAIDAEKRAADRPARREIGSQQ
jgi:hypothetical protein